MKIKKIGAKNFKSFKNLDLELGNFNVIVGANASGKSNFVQIFKFLRDIEQNDLRNAVSMNGGITSLCNIPEQGKNLEIYFSVENKQAFRIENWVLRFSQSDASFVLKPNLDSKEFSICNDEFSQAINLVERKKEEKELWENLQAENSGTITVKMKGDHPDIEITPDAIKEKLKNFSFIPPKEIMSRIFRKKEILLFQRPLPFLPIRQELFGDVGIYDFDPHSMKNPVKIAGKADLEEDGKNMALVLNRVIEDDAKKRKLNNLLNLLLPFVVTAGTEKFAEKSLMATLQEKYYNRELRADLLSDGTVSITALLLALYFENKDVVFLEEPERNIHPQLAAGLVEMMKEASQKKQIIVTTHSPEIVKYAGIENILLVSRDDNGFSAITRPADKKEMRIFLQNQIGLDELYVQNLLMA